MRGRHERRGPLAWFGKRADDIVDRAVTNALDGPEQADAQWLTDEQWLTALTPAEVDQMRQHAGIVEDLTRCVQIGWRPYSAHVDEQLDRLAAIARAREAVR